MSTELNSLLSKLYFVSGLCSLCVWCYLLTKTKHTHTHNKAFTSLCVVSALWAVCHWGIDYTGNYWISNTVVGKRALLIHTHSHKQPHALILTHKHHTHNYLQELGMKYITKLNSTSNCSNREKWMFAASNNDLFTPIGSKRGSGSNGSLCVCPVDTLICEG